MPPRAMLAAVAGAAISAAMAVAAPKHAALVLIDDMGYGDSYVMQVCSPTRTSLLTGRGFDYWLGYYGAAEDYYLHGGKKTLDFHENYDQAPQYPPERYYAACAHITESNRKTYCAMMQALDEGIGNLTAAYTGVGVWDDTVLVFLSDNGGEVGSGGYNVPLRGQKATVWEGGVRSQTFDGELDGVDVWAAVRDGSPSPRTEMLLSMRDADECTKGAQTKGGDCAYPGQTAFRSGRYKLIYGHPALRGHVDACSWDNRTGVLSCWNGWSRPFEAGAPRAPPVMPPSAGQPAGSSVYQYGGLTARLAAFNATQISQDVEPCPKKGSCGEEQCGALQCA
eukprot:gene34374-7105_t